MSTLGTLNEERKKNKSCQKINYEIRIKDNLNIEKALTTEEKDQLMQGMDKTNSAVDAFFHMRKMLARYRDTQDEPTPPPVVTKASDSDSVSTLSQTSME